MNLKKYSVGSIRPVLVDPSILYVELTSNIFFDGTKTELLPQQVAGNAAKGITEYLKTSPYHQSVWILNQLKIP